MKEGIGLTKSGTFRTSPLRLSAIPIYTLYGEDQVSDQLDFLHIETIASRSSLHDWEISPHRHAGFVQALLVREGHVRVSFDGVDTEQDGPLAVVAPAGTVHGFRFDEGTTGWVLTLPSDFTARAEGPGDPLQNLLLRGGQLALDPAAALRVAWLAGEMLVMQETARAQAPLRRAMAEALVRSLVLPDDVAQDAQSPQPRLERFRQLVEAHYREHRDLDFYAAALGMTRRSLSRLTAARLGCSPITVLHRRLATEARRLLRYTGASAAQIAAELGFEDPSYFSRFYLRMTGKRPGDERA